MLHFKCSIFILFIAFLIQHTSEEEVGALEAKFDEIDLQESSDEAIGDRIMEEMNGMKEKFDIALSRIGEQIEKDQQEQDEMQLSKSL